MRITDNELNELLLQVGENIKPLHIEYDMYHSTALNTGLRVFEILDMEKYIIAIDRQDLLIRTEKTNNIRTIEIEAIHPNIITRYNLGLPSFMRITYNQLNLQLKKSGLAGIRVNGKKATTSHLYRHNYAKQLYAKYQSIEIVAEELKITAPIALKYIQSKIEKAR